MGTNGAFPVFDWGKELVDLVADLVCVCRDGQVVYINSAGAQMLGGEARAIIGRPFADFLHADYAAAADLSSLAAESTPSPLILTRLDGKPVQVEALARKSRGGLNTTLVRARDIGWSIRIASLLQNCGTRQGEPLPDDDAIWNPLQERLLLAATMFDAVPLGIVLCGTDRVVSAVNPAFATVTGHPRASIEGARLEALAPEGEKTSFLADMWTALDGTGRWQGNVTLRAADGAAKPAHISAVTARDAEGATHAYVVTIGTGPTADHEEDKERTSNETTIDQATGLPRLAPFLSRLSQSVAGASRSGERIGLMMIDIGGLVTPGSGAQYAEAALRKTVDVLSSCVRDYDTLARLGDNLFAITMSNLEGPHSAAIVARRVVQKFAQPTGDGVRLVPSIGIVVYPVDGPDTASLLRDADAAMQKAKTFSAPNFRFFDPELNRDAQDRLALWRELARAHEKGEFHIHYQPRIELMSGRATAVEALLRWQNPKLGAVDMDRFIPALEEIGGMETVGAWMLEEVCRQQVAWTKAGHLYLRLSVNLSERQLRQRGFLGIVRDVIRRTGADPGRIEVEIIEEMLVRDAESCVATLWGLREIGITVVLDNFGSGEGSINRLRRFPISVVKIDPQFTIDLSGRRSPAISAIVGMAHGFEQTVVADGVESEEQLDSLRLSGCDEAQGLLFCSPLSAAQITPRLGLATWRGVGKL